METYILIGISDKTGLPIIQAKHCKEGQDPRNVFMAGGVAGFEQYNTPGVLEILSAERKKEKGVCGFEC